MSRGAVAAISIGALCLLVGCHSNATITTPKPVKVVIPKLVVAPAKAGCRALDSALPATIERLATRPTTPESPLVHAWGNPATVLQCGIMGTVKALVNTENSVGVSASNGSAKVEWWQREIPATAPVVTVWTALFASTGVSLTVPTSYNDDNDSPLLLDLDPLLIQQLGADRS